MAASKGRSGEPTPDAAGLAIAIGESETPSTPSPQIQSATAVAFLTALFAHTTHPIWICSLPNVRGDDSTGPEDRIRTRNSAEIGDFIARSNDPARSIYFCVGTIEGRKRNKETVRELPSLHVDIDFKDVIDAPDNILKRLKALRLPPSTIVHSGHGLHCYWLLTEPMPAIEIDRIEATLKLLCDLCGGDMAVTQVAALMRVPGSINSKACDDGGESVAVTIIENNGHAFELDDIEEMLSETSPIVQRKARETEHTVGDSNFFTEYAACHGYKPPIDVEERLGAMMYMGGNDASIHRTQLSVSASMLNRGVDPETVVGLVLAATRVAAGSYGPRWNWKAEDRNLRKMCVTWQKKRVNEKQTKPASASPSPPSAIAPAYSEEFLALVFADQHETDLRFVAKWGQWFRWDQLRWLLEETLHAFDLSRLICREAANACNKPSLSKAIASAKTVAAVERLAKADRRLAATVEQWDTEPEKFNTAEED